MLREIDSKHSRQRVFLDETERVVRWREFPALIAPCAPVKATRHKLFPIEGMFRFHFMQQFGAVRRGDGRSAVRCTAVLAIRRT